MFNFLPSKTREELRKEYKRRRWSVFFIFTFFLGTISVVFFVPTCLTVYLEKQHLSEELDTLKKESNNLTNLELSEKLKNISKITSTLKPYIKEVPVTEILDSILERKSEDIILFSFAIKNEKNQGKLQISLSGIARDRDVLLQFSESLKEEEFISEVDIPLSSFTKEENLDFSMQIKGEI